MRAGWALLPLLAASSLAAAVAAGPAEVVMERGKAEEPLTVLVRAPADLGDLLLDYNGGLRPDYGRRPLNVSVGLVLLTGVWRRGVLETSAFLNLAWKDARLAFRASKGEVKERRGRDGDVGHVQGPISKCGARRWPSSGSPTSSSPARPSRSRRSPASPPSPPPYLPSPSHLPPISDDGAWEGEVEWSRYLDLDLACPLPASPPFSACTAPLALESLGFGSSDVALGWGATSFQSSSAIAELATSRPESKIPRLEAVLNVATPYTDAVLSYILRKEAGEL